MKIIFRIILGLVILVSLFYAEENWRGKRAWENCKRELAAKGVSLNWDDYIPPPVPDDENFFKAPKMVEWFVKINGQMTNELTARLHEPHMTAVTIGEIVVLPPSTNVNASAENVDIAVRYSSFGKAVFLSAPIETNMSSPNFTIPLIQFEDVPITTAIENLARLAGVRYLLDPEIGYNRPDKNGQIKPEPTFSLRWKNITALQALLAVLNRYDLQLIDELSPGDARITMKTSGGGIYAAADTHKKISQLFQDAVGTNAIASQGFALLMKPLDQIKPVRMVWHSEKAPDQKEIIQFFEEFFPDNAVKLTSSRFHIQSEGGNSFRIVWDSVSATDYLAWSDPFESDFNLIREALKRSYARIDGDYSKPFAMPIPNFITVRSVAQTLDQRAKCYLLLGQPDKAFREVTLMHEMCRLLQGAPTGKPMTLVAAMINVAVAGLYVDTIANGFRLHAWQEPQLAAFQEQLKEINLTSFVVEALKTEPVGVCHTMEIIMAGQDNFSKDNWWREIKQTGIPWMPRGWMYQNMVNVAKLDQNWLNGFDLAEDKISPRKFDEVAGDLEKFFDRESPFRFFSAPFKLLAAIVIPNFARAEQTTAYNQTLADEAQIVCALERYHLAHGDYPETLEPLTPQFMEKIPRDIIGGEPLHYHRTEDGKFLLYSVGWNETDDGGLSGTLSDVKIGDWVWKN